MFGLTKKDNETAPADEGATQADNFFPEPEVAPATPDPEEKPAELLLVEEPAVAEEPAAVLPTVGMHKISKSALSSDGFHAFVEEKVLKFLSIMDIENPGRRRSAIIALNLGEEGIIERLALSASFLRLQTDYGLENGHPEMVQESKIYSAKLTAMKLWLTIR